LLFQESSPCCLCGDGESLGQPKPRVKRKLNYFCEGKPEAQQKARTRRAMQRDGYG
jgi:hypothetical protein